MRNKVTTASTVRRLLENARYEILPTASIEATVLEHVPVGHTITVTASPKKGLGPTLDLTGDVAADMDRIRAFYADKAGLRPEHRVEPRLREERDAAD